MCVFYCRYFKLDRAYNYYINHTHHPNTLNDIWFTLNIIIVLYDKLCIQINSGSKSCGVLYFLTRVLFNNSLCIICIHNIIFSPSPSETFLSYLSMMTIILSQ